MGCTHSSVCEVKPYFLEDYTFSIDGNFCNFLVSLQVKRLKAEELKANYQEEAALQR